MADLVERAHIHAGLLSAYGTVQNEPTENELWAGCKDAAPVLSECAKEIERLRRELDKTQDRFTWLRTQLAVVRGFVDRDEKAEAQERIDYTWREIGLFLERNQS
jgi:hypothetical protein